MEIHKTLGSVVLSLSLAACASSSEKEMTPSAPPNPTLDGPGAVVEDPYMWLEDVTGERSMTWVKAQNAVSTVELEAVPGFAAMRARILAILDSKEKIPWVAKRGKYLVNLWQDEAHPRGLWRRTTLAEYKKAAPKWEVLLDLDALGKSENESWVWQGADCLYPKYERCLLSLSRGGADAVVVREFDVEKKAFVADGFNLPEAKSAIGWKDFDTVYVGTDFGPGSFTDSGYPRIAKEWKRGTPLASATTIIEGKASDIEVVASRDHDHGKVRDVVTVAPTFFTNDAYVIQADGLKKIDKPTDADVTFWNDQVLVTLRSDWTVSGKTWPAGSLIAQDAAGFMAGKRDGFAALFTPRPNSALSAAVGLKTGVLVNELEDVHNALFMWTHAKSGWRREPVPMPPLASFSTFAWDADEGDDYLMTDDSFVAPTSLTLVLGKSNKKEVLKRAPAFFDASNLEVSQHFVTSRDGVRVPYFQVAKKDLVLDGSHPTLIEGYGGFEVSLTPGYDAVTGAAWIERGGVYVVPNLRGGGEYGPAWHQAAMKQNRQRAYDDFAAVAEVLIARAVTRPAKLGILGGSNGGLLVGVMMTERPELFGAVVCQAPLLDMKRYSQLLAGASWMDEYGDPSVPAEWEWIAKYSPYQNVKTGVRYPRVLFTTSTRDDRVHPGHARKMMARMREQGHDALFYENIEGGHGGAADSGQRTYLSSLAFAFLWHQLGI